MPSPTPTRSRKALAALSGALLAAVSGGWVGEAIASPFAMRGEGGGRAPSFGPRPGGWGERPGPVWSGPRRPFPVDRPVRRPGWDAPAYEEEMVLRPRRPAPALAAEPGPRRAAPRPARAAARPASPPHRPSVAAKKPPAKVARPSPPRPLPTRTRPTVPVEARYVADEVLCELPPGGPVADGARVAAAYRLDRLSWQPLGEAGGRLLRYRIRDGRTVESVVRALQADRRVASAQPNHLFRLQGTAAAGLSGAQYAARKLHLAEAHTIATGEGVTVAVIDSGVDAAHPELAGAFAANVNALGSEAKSNVAAEAHGTAIAAVIAARGQLAGVAPRARLLAIRAFAGSGSAAQGTTADIVKAVGVATEAGARVVNMSFAGPRDPLVARVVAAGTARGLVFVAAAGNGGPRAAPSYPAAEPGVIAVTATDAADGAFGQANRGDYVGLAAPGVDLLVAEPGGAYGFSSGTSLAAAHVSGIVALMLQRDPGLTPDAVRRRLAETARDLGAAGRDPEFGAGLVDALAPLAPAAVTALEP